MAAVSGFSNVEVNVWLPRDDEGNFSNSGLGGVMDKKQQGSASVGHVSMRMCTWQLGSAPSVSRHVCTVHCVTEYASLWPAKEFGGKDGATTLVTFDQDYKKKKSNPDTIISMSRLNVHAMITAFKDIKLRVARGDLNWRLCVSGSGKLTKKRASCASLVWTLLRVGGIDALGLPYHSHIKDSGPTDPNFYKTTKCDAGDILGGAFNGIFWAEWFFSPKALLLRVASAVEGCLDDKQITQKIMSPEIPTPPPAPSPAIPAKWAEVYKLMMQHRLLSYFIGKPAEFAQAKADALTGNVHAKGALAYHKMYIEEQKGYGWGITPERVGGHVFGGIDRSYIVGFHHLVPR